MKAMLRLIFALTGLALSVGLASVRHMDEYYYDYGDTCSDEAGEDPGVQACFAAIEPCVDACVSAGGDYVDCENGCGIGSCWAEYYDVLEGCDSDRQEDCSTTCGRDCSAMSQSCASADYDDGAGECDYDCE